MSARLRSRIISDGKYDKFGGFAVPHRASIVRCRCWPASDSCTPKGRFIITTDHHRPAEPVSSGEPLSAHDGAGACRKGYLGLATSAADLQPWKAWKPGEKSFAYRGNYDRLTR